MYSSSLFSCTRGSSETLHAAVTGTNIAWLLSSVKRSSPGAATIRVPSPLPWRRVSSGAASSGIEMVTPTWLGVGVETMRHLPTLRALGAGAGLGLGLGLGLGPGSGSEVVSEVAAPTAEPSVVLKV